MKKIFLIRCRVLSNRQEGCAMEQCNTALRQKKSTFTEISIVNMDFCFPKHLLYHVVLQ